MSTYLMKREGCSEIAPSLAVEDICSQHSSLVALIAEIALSGIIAVMLCIMHKLLRKVGGNKTAT